MNFLRKNIHNHKQQDDNGNDFDGGFYGMGIKKIEHGWCFYSRCEGDATHITALTVLDGK